MTHVTPLIGGDLVVVEDHAAQLRKFKLAQRDTLPRAMNGRPIAPSDPYAASVLKDIQQEKSQEYKRLLATDLCAIRDGVPLPILMQPIRYHEAVLTAHSGQFKERSLIALSRAETREETEVTLAQMRLSPETITDPDTLENLIEKASKYQALFSEFVAQAHLHLARVRGQQLVFAAPRVPPVLIRLK